MGVITFDGISSSGIGVTVEGYSSAPMAEKSVERVSVPGRNGNLIIDNGSFLGYKQKYKMHWRRSNEARTSVVNWLYRDGYRKFVDSNDPNHFRMANFVGGVEVDNRMDVLDRAEFEFHFKPQRFLNSGETAISVTNGRTISNPSKFDSLPEITVNGARSGAKLTVNGYVITFTGNFTGTIDCENGNAVQGTTPANNLISCSDFPKLKTGNNTVSWTGTITSVSIKGRWWEL